MLGRCEGIERVEVPSLVVVGELTRVMFGIDNHLALTARSAQLDPLFLRLHASDYADSYV